MTSHNSSGVEHFLLHLTLERRLEKLRQKNFLKHTLLFLFSALLTVFILFGFVFEIERINGTSMFPTLEHGTIAFSYRLEKKYSRGDIVILENIGQDDLIKRIIGIPGDTIDLDEETGMISLNGQILYEPYLTQGTALSQSGVSFPITLADDQYFVLGDNRANSVDSRYYGAIDRSHIKARLFFHF